MATVTSEGTYEQKNIFTFFHSEHGKKKYICSPGAQDHGLCGKNFKQSERILSSVNILIPWWEFSN